MYSYTSIGMDLMEVHGVHSSFSDGFAFVAQFTDEEPGVDGFKELVTVGAVKVKVQVVQQTHAHAVGYDHQLPG